MSLERSEPSPGPGDSARRRPSHLRVAVLDRDAGLIQVLFKRMHALGHEQRTLSGPLRLDALVAMHLHAMVLDPTILGPSGWGYLEQLCAGLPGLAVVVCTGPSSVAERIRGLRLGADAWVTKPCHPEELICVVEAAARRHRHATTPPADAPATFGEITIRPDLHQAYVNGLSLELTAREFELMQLLSGTDRVLRREEIYERVWGYAMARGDRSVDVFVRRLRRKLRSRSPGWSYLHTHFGVGYRFAPECVDAARDPAEAPAERDAGTPQRPRSQPVHTAVTS